MEWEEAEQQVKAIMEKHGYRTKAGVPARIEWEGREHLLDIRCVQCANLRDTHRVALRIEAAVHERKDRWMSARQIGELAEGRSITRWRYTGLMRRRRLTG